jgi:hypothetical protein
MGQRIISQFIIYKLSNIIYTSFIFNILHIIIYIIIRANVNIYIYKRIEEENIHCLFAATVKVGSSRLIQSDSCVHYITIGKHNIFSFVAMSTDSVPSSKTNIFQNKLIYCRHFRTYSQCAMFDWSDTVATSALHYCYFPPISGALLTGSNLWK